MGTAAGDIHDIGIKIMISGGQINEQIREYVGADAHGKDAMGSVSLARQWIGGK
jgi:methanogenic corrinoid protein MtbC1